MKRKFPKVRVFDGENFRHYMTAYRKKHAVTVAKRLRKKGWKVRIIPGKGIWADDVYNIYRRKR
jgi:hypothetical protein